MKYVIACEYNIVYDLPKGFLGKGTLPANEPFWARKFNTKAEARKELSRRQQKEDTGTVFANYGEMFFNNCDVFSVAALED